MAELKQGDKVQFVDAETLAEHGRRGLNVKLSYANQKGQIALVMGDQYTVMLENHNMVVVPSYVLVEA